MTCDVGLLFESESMAIRLAPPGHALASFCVAVAVRAMQSRLRFGLRRQMRIEQRSG
jgi:hypothetical protein